MTILHSIVAVELCMRLEASSEPRQRLHQLVARHPEQTTPGAKWELVRDIVGTLSQHLELAERGCWDFFDDDARAQRDFKMWSDGMITREGVRPSPNQRDAYRGGEALYMTFTIALLLRQGSPGERTLAARCDIPESHLWARGTFRHVLQSLTGLSFASVRGDVVYLIPGEESWGLTASDLAEPKFHYLRPIVG